MSASETDVVKGIRSEYQYGFSNSDEAENYFFKSGRGLSHEDFGRRSVRRQVDDFSGTRPVVEVLTSVVD